MKAFIRCSQDPWRITYSWSKKAT